LVWTDFASNLMSRPMSLTKQANALEEPNRSTSLLQQSRYPIRNQVIFLLSEGRFTSESGVRQ
jgi:hypothetical protein